MSSATYKDVVEQGSGWGAAVNAVEESWPALRSNLSSVSPRHLVLVGCGSTHHLAETAASLWRGATDWIVTATPASEFLGDPRGLLPWPEQTILVAFSRSGSTSETVAAVEAFRAMGGAGVWSITCRSDSPLSGASDVAVAIDRGFEPQIAQTRSFSSMLVAAESIAKLMRGEPVVSARTAEQLGLTAVEKALQVLEGPDQMALMRRIGRIDLLGSGSCYGIAREATLKFTELALTASGAFHVPEYRHGPKAMVCDTTLVIGVIDPSDGDLGLDVLEEVERMGGHSLAVSSVPHGLLASVMPTLQLLALRRAEQAGIDPDSPRHLTAVVELPGSDRSLQVRRSTNRSARGTLSSAP